MEVTTIAAQAEYKAKKQQGTHLEGRPQPFTRHYDVPYVNLDEVDHGVPYKNMVDIYVPSNVAVRSPSGGEGASPLHGAEASGSPHNKRPVMVFVHGGGWKRFDRRSKFYSNVGEAFAARGFVTVSVSYRLSFIRTEDLACWYLFLSLLIGAIVAATVIPTASTTKAAYAVPLAFLCPLAFGCLHWLAERARGARGCRGACTAKPVHHPMHCEDVAAALAWVIRNIDKYGGDPTLICLAGHSAGGHIVSMLAVQPKFMADAGVPRAFSDNVKAVACLSGVYDADLLEDVHSPWYMAPARAFRRVWFLRAAFGPDRNQWNHAFPSAVCSQPGHLEQLELPPLLLVNASNDLGLDVHSAKFGAQLQEAGFHVKHIILQGCNHFDYIMGMGRPGWLGNVIVEPLLDSFFREHLRADVPCKRAAVEEIDVRVDAAPTGAGAMPSAAPAPPSLQPEPGSAKAS